MEKPKGRGVDRIPEPDAGSLAWGRDVARRLGRRMPWYTPSFAAPLLGVALSDWLGIRLAFGLSSVVRLAGVLLFFRLVRQG